MCNVSVKRIYISQLNEVMNTKPGGFSVMIFDEYAWFASQLFLEHCRCTDWEAKPWRADTTDFIGIFKLHPLDVPALVVRFIAELNLCDTITKTRNRTINPVFQTQSPIIVYQWDSAEDMWGTGSGSRGIGPVRAVTQSPSILGRVSGQGQWQSHPALYFVSRLSFIHHPGYCQFPIACKPNLSPASAWNAADTDGILRLWSWLQNSIRGLSKAKKSWACISTEVFSQLKAHFAPSDDVAWPFQNAYAHMPTALGLLPVDSAVGLRKDLQNFEDKTKPQNLGQ